MTRFQRLALVALPLIGIAGAAMLSAQTAEPDREIEMGGWHVEDVATPSEDDPQAREVRMRRGGNGAPELAVILHLNSSDVLEGWGTGVYDASFSNGGHICGSGGSLLDDDSGPPAERVRRARATLERRIAEMSTRCDSAQSLMSGYLDGFEGAFTLLTAWHGERQARMREAEALADPYNVAVDYDADMNMTTGEYDNATYSVENFYYGDADGNLATPE